MAKWIARILCSVLILSMFIMINTPYIYAEGDTAVPSNSSSQAILEQAITSVKLADQAGKLNPASYDVQFAKDTTAYGYIDSIFPDRSGEHMIVVYQTDSKVFRDGKPQDGIIKIASMRISDGTQVWETIIGNRQLGKSVSNVQANGEIFLTTQDKTNLYLHTINEQTGKITRTIQQYNPFKNSVESWKYWLLDHNQLVVTYTFSNQSTLRYFDATGKLLQTRTIAGIIRDAQSNRILVTDGNIVHYTLSVQDHKGNYIFQTSIDDPGYFWDAYLLPNLSVAIESQRNDNGKSGYTLTKYTAKGQKQWQHTREDEPWPYYSHGNQIIEILGRQEKVFSFNNQGKETNLLTSNGDGWIELRNHEIYFTGHKIRIADATTMKWLAELQYKDSEPQVTWLGKQQLAMYDSKNKIISVIHIKGK